MPADEYVGRTPAGRVTHALPEVDPPAQPGDLPPAWQGNKTIFALCGAEIRWVAHYDDRRPQEITCKRCLQRQES